MKVTFFVHAAESLECTLDYFQKMNVIGLYNRFMEYRHTIKAFRKEMLLSQTELAKRLGVSFATVNRWENGLHDPTCAARRRLRPLFKKYGIEVEEK